MGVAARAVVGFDAVLGRGAAGVAAIRLVFKRSGYRTIARLVRALDGNLLRAYGHGFCASGLFEISTLKICAEGSDGV